MEVLIPLFLIVAGAVYWVASSGKRKQKQRQKIVQLPFPKEWRMILRKNLPFFYKMPADIQLQLKNKMQVFLAEKQFVGREGQEITDEVRVTIAAQACLLLLNRETDFYPFLKTIVVYPSAFITKHPQYDPSGVQKTEARVLLGESWTRGQVILSWHHSATGGNDFNDGQNLVIHEFAHQLDGESGVTNGAPPLNKGQTYATWSEIFSTEFEALRADARRGHRTLLDKYGTTNPAEFFAVASEMFFERPEELQKEHTKLYTQLAQYYCIDPAAW